MINFELQFSEDVKSLSVSVAIDTDHSSTYYIQSVYLEYYKNRNVSNIASPKALLLYENQRLDPQSLIPVDTPDITKKSWSGIVQESQLDYDANGVAKFKDGLFYVIVVCQNVNYTEHPDDVVVSVNGVLDWTAVYDRGMSFVDRALVSSKAGACTISDDLEQAILVWHAIDLALAANDADELDRLWSRFVTFSPLGGGSGSSCNCI